MQHQVANSPKCANRNRASVPEVQSTDAAEKSTGSVVKVYFRKNLPIYQEV
jgi:hypothetical protein